MPGLAERLWEARKQGSVVRPEDVIEPSSTEEAYAIQGQIVRLSGYEVCGFKVGSTSKEAQQFLGISEPGSGALLAPYLHMTSAQVVIVPLRCPR
jgi:2-keto-4-pentenoate hydratase